MDIFKKINIKKNELKDAIKTSRIYKRLRSIIIKFPILYRFQKQGRFLLKLQYTFMSRAKFKALIMFICSFVAIFFAFTASIVPTLGNSFREAEVSSLAPYKSYTNYSQNAVPTPGGNDKYLFPYPTQLNTKSDILYKDPLNTELPIISFTGYGSSFSPDTFDYNDPSSYSFYLLKNKLNEIKGLENIYDLNYKDESGSSLKTVSACSSILTSLLESVITGGLGGFFLDTQTLNSLRFIDDYSWYQYQSHKSQAGKELYLSSWIISRNFAKILTRSLIKGPINGNSSALGIFEPFMSNDNSNINLSISSCLADVFYYFAPYVIKNNMGENVKVIDAEFQKYYNITKVSDKTYALPYTIQYFIDYDKFIHNNTFLSLGSVPYSPKHGDQLYTNFETSNVKNNEDINIAGLNEYCKFWDKNKNSLNILKKYGAYSKYSNYNNLKTGLSEKDAIPIVVNRTAIEKEHYKIGQYILTKASRVTFKDTDSLNRKSVNTTWNELSYFRIVGAVNNLGPASFFTSRQECNALVLSKPNTLYNESDNSLKVISNDIENNNPFIYQNITSWDPSKNDLGGMIKGSALYGDGLGYYNSVLYTSNGNPATAGLVLSCSGDYSILGPLGVNFGVENLFSGKIAEDTVNNVIQFFLIYGYTISGFLLLLSILLFILSQRIIIASNKKNTLVLKVVGYSSLYIQLVTSFLYIFMGILFSIFILIFYKDVANLILNMFSQVLSFNTYIPIAPISILLLVIYIAIIFVYYFIFIYISKRGIKKSKAIDYNKE